jgi:hypothetical protein
MRLLGTIFNINLEDRGESFLTAKAQNFKKEIP